MTYADLWKLVSESRISTEKAAEYIGISGMTLRRWKSRPLDQDLPTLYANTCTIAVYHLIAEGLLPPDSAVGLQIIADAGDRFLRPMCEVLGLPRDFFKHAAHDSEAMVAGLSQIGASPERQKAVKKKEDLILTFVSWGEAWRRCITGLHRVLRSEELSPADKQVAYGAFFYLITPLDLIPDAVPAIGYLDNFAVLSMALMHYERHFAELFKDAQPA
jgi:uncharacterized membrane protein YkvA (DUF1232 family)